MIAHVGQITLNQLFLFIHCSVLSCKLNYKQYLLSNLIDTSTHLLDTLLLEIKLIEKELLNKLLVG